MKIILYVVFSGAVGFLAGCADDERYHHRHSHAAYSDSRVEYPERHYRDHETRYDNDRRDGPDVKVRF